MLLLFGLISVTPTLIPILLGNNWLPMILPLQILCIAGIVKSITTFVGSILLSKGRSDIEFKLNIIKAIIIPLVILFGIQYGIIGVSISMTVLTLSSFLILQKITNKIINLSFLSFFKALYPATASSIIMMITVMVFQKFYIYFSLGLSFFFY